MAATDTSPADDCCSAAAAVVVSLAGCRCLCLAFAGSHNSPEHSHQSQAVAGSADRMLVQPTTEDKYDRILAFVDAHATPVAMDSSWSSVSSSEFDQLEQDPATSSWHHSYDEEAEEGEELHEPCVMAFAAGLPAAVAESAAAAASLTTAGSWSYGNAINPKPFFFAWDEEAEGAFELEPACSSNACDVAAAVPADPMAAAVALRAQRRASVHEARHAARTSRRMRRSKLHAQLGDLEYMQAWVQPSEQKQKQQSSRRSAAGIKYQQLLALVAGDSAAGQYRHPKHWHLTFDEDVHGPEAPETVLGSC